MNKGRHLTFKKSKSDHQNCKLNNKEEEFDSDESF